MWLAFLPMAATPLWQLLQPLVIPVWSKRVAGRHARLEWQLSQPAVVGMCPAGLPVAATPLWQLAQLPVTCVWSTRVAGFHAVVA